MQEKQKKGNRIEQDKEIHHAGDKSFKVIMKQKESALEYVEKLFPELYALLDLTYFELDNTNYIATGFDEFYSDVVYRSFLKSTVGKRKKRVAIVLLFEHKKTIRSYFSLFLQLLEYIVLIWKEDLANSRKPSVIVPIVFFQGKKGLRCKQMHDCFKGIPLELLAFIPNFTCHFTDIHGLPTTEILNLDEKGLLRSLFLAYLYKEKKAHISNMLIEVFKFLEHDPDKFDYFRLIFDFLAQEDYLSADEINELIAHITSPKIKEDMLTSAQVWKQEGKIEGKIETARLTVLRGRRRGLPFDVLVDISELPSKDVENLLIGYDKVYTCWLMSQSPKDTPFLTDSEISYLIHLFNNTPQL